LHLILDNKVTIEEVIKHGKDNNHMWSVFLKIDTGYHRHGVDPVADPKGCIEIVKLLNKVHQEKLLTFRGLYSHAGHSYDGNTAEEIACVANSEVDIMNNFVTLLEKEAHERVPEVISIGSTPGCSFLPENMGRVTEIHPGNYIFYDTTQSDLGSCKPDDVAVRVLTRVVGHYPDRDKLIVDAGSLALSKDKGACKKNFVDRGYGLIERHPNLYFEKVSQEVGVIGLRQEYAAKGQKLNFDQFKINSLLKIIPNHSCLACACYNKYEVVDDNDSDKIIDQWETCRGWY